MARNTAAANTNSSTLSYPSANSMSSFVPSPKAKTIEPNIKPEEIHVQVAYSHHRNRYHAKVHPANQEMVDKVMQNCRTYCPHATKTALIQSNDHMFTANNFWIGTLEATPELFEGAAGKPSHFTSKQAPVAQRLPPRLRLASPAQKQLQRQCNSIQRRFGTIGGGKANRSPVWAIPPSEAVFDPAQARPAGCDPNCTEYDQLMFCNRGLTTKSQPDPLGLHGSIEESVQKNLNRRPMSAANQSVGGGGGGGAAPRSQSTPAFVGHTGGQEKGKTSKKESTRGEAFESRTKFCGGQRETSRTSLSRSRGMRRCQSTSQRIPLGDVETQLAQKIAATLLTSKVLQTSRLEQKMFRPKSRV